MSAGSGAPRRGAGIGTDWLRKMDLKPRDVTALLVGMKTRFSVFGLQRELNMDPKEPLSAILPGATLAELWSLMGNVEKALRAISAMVAAAAFLGMLAMLLAGLSERRREIAILRAVGARAWHIVALIISEAAALTVLAIVLGLGLLFGGLAIARPLIAEFVGVQSGWGGLEAFDLVYLAGFLAIDLLAGLPTAFAAYRRSLSERLIPRQ